MTSDKAAIDASWKMFLALNASQAEISNKQMPKSIDKDMSEKIQEAQNRISTLENDLKKSNGNNHLIMIIKLTKIFQQ
jgi:predicted adenine nucleotide alpha hydrolase (AANH) superfamily ATPase